MKPPAAEAEVLLSRVISDLRTQWRDLVLLAASIRSHVAPEEWSSYAEFLARQTKVGPDSLTRKLDAIHYHFGLGHTADEIIELGQEKVLSDYQRSRRAEKYEDQVQLRFTLPGSLRELVRQDLERISKVLQFRTAEQLWDYLHAIFQDLSDADLQHLAGEFSGKKQRSNSSKKS